MPDLLIKDAELKQLDNLIGEVPTKFGLPLIQFFQLISQKRQTEQQVLKNVSLSDEKSNEKEKEK